MTKQEVVHPPLCDNFDRAQFGALLLKEITPWFTSELHKCKAEIIAAIHCSATWLTEYPSQRGPASEEVAGTSLAGTDRLGERPSSFGKRPSPRSSSSRYAGTLNQGQTSSAQSRFRLPPSPFTVGAEDTRNRGGRSEQKAARNHSTERQKAGMQKLRSALDTELLQRESIIPTSLSKDKTSAVASSGDSFSRILPLTPDNLQAPARELRQVPAPLDRGDDRSLASWAPSPEVVGRKVDLTADSETSSNQWMQRFTPSSAESAADARPTPGMRPTPPGAPPALASDADSDFPLDVPEAAVGLRESLSLSSEVPNDRFFSVGSKLNNKKLMSVSELLHVRTEELTAEICRERSITPVSRTNRGCGLGICSKICSVILVASGAVPWDFGTGRSLWRPAVWCQRLVLVLAVLSIAACTEQTWTRSSYGWSEPPCHGSACLQLGMLSDLPLAIGSVLSLLLLGTPLGSRDLCNCLQMLYSYALRQDLLSDWFRRMRPMVVITFFAWAGANLERLHHNGGLEAIHNGEMDAHCVLHSSAFLVISTLLMSVAFCCLFVLIALAGMVDDFCSGVSESRSLADAIHEWNLLQATLRQGSSAIDRAWFGLQVTVVATMFANLSDVVSNEQSATTFLPVAGIVFVIVMAMFCAAVVSDKVGRVPSLINSLSFGKDFDLERQYVVEFVKNSQAGFHVFDVRLTSDMALKFVYICIVAMFAVMTKGLV